MKESLSVRFLYQTTVGRGLLKILVNPNVSRAIGAFLDSSCSKLLISYFVKSNNIDLNGVIIPKEGFQSFNSFFCRKKELMQIKPDENVIISPCDAFLSCLPIKGNAVYDVKHTQFTIGELLGDEKLGEEFEDGIALIFRLTPAHYHRYCYATNGKVLRAKRIMGILHCVRPIVTRQIPVYAQNSREYQLLQTKNFGKVVQMEVGALMVGRITNPEIRTSRLVTAGKEKGYFEFGGSTIILLFQKDKLQLADQFKNAKEADVHYGMQIGTKMYVF